MESTFTDIKGHYCYIVEIIENHYYYQAQFEFRGGTWYVVERESYNWEWSLTGEVN